MKYEIHIGEISYLDGTPSKPRIVIIITKEQLDVIEMFAIKKRDKDFNTIYQINECEFKVVPHLVEPEEKVSYEDLLTYKQVTIRESIMPNGNHFVDEDNE